LIKAFISAKADRYRPSYGKVVEKFPRQCVLAGTTNNKKYLRDRTGNRRFWPVPVRHRINIPWVRKWREQLLAEAYVLFLEGVRVLPRPGHGAAPVRADAGGPPGEIRRCSPSCCTC
jgi:putative DNA primase/helicase